MNQLQRFQSGIDIRESMQFKMLFLDEDSKDIGCENCRISKAHWEGSVLKRHPNQEQKMQYPAKPYVCSAKCSQQLHNNYLIDHYGFWTKQPEGNYCLVCVSNNNNNGRNDK